MGNPVKCLLMALLWQLVTSQGMTSTPPLSQKPHCFSLVGHTCKEVFILIVGTTLGFIGIVAGLYICYLVYALGTTEAMDLFCCRRWWCRRCAPRDEEARQIIDEIADVDPDEISAVVVDDRCSECAENATKASGKREGQDQGSVTKKPRLDREPFSMPNSPSGIRINPDLTSSTPTKPSRNEGYNFQRAEEQFDPKNLEKIDIKEEKVPVIKEEPESEVDVNLSKVSTNGSATKVEETPSPFEKVETNNDPIDDGIDVLTTPEPETGEVEVKAKNPPKELQEAVTAESKEHPIDHSPEEPQEVVVAGQSPVEYQEDPIEDLPEEHPDNRATSGSSFERIDEDQCADALECEDDAIAGEGSSCKSPTTRTLEEANFIADSSPVSYNTMSESLDKSAVSCSPSQSETKDCKSEKASGESADSEATESADEGPGSPSDPERKDSFLRSFVEKNTTTASEPKSREESDED